MREHTRTQTSVHLAEPGTSEGDDIDVKVRHITVEDSPIDREYMTVQIDRTVFFGDPVQLNNLFREVVMKMNDIAVTWKEDA